METDWLEMVDIVSQYWQYRYQHGIDIGIDKIDIDVIDIDCTNASIYLNINSLNTIEES